MKKILLFLLVACSQSVNAQTVLDTLDTPEGTMLIYSNRTWKYLEDKGFDGILNPWLHNYFVNDTTYQFSQKWDNNSCFTATKGNDMSKIKDTVWLCVQDEAHADFHIPAPGVVTSRYGYRSGRYHNGIDIDLNTGDTVRAAWAGKVRYAKWNDGGFGNLIVIRHYNGLETFYAHLSKHLVAPDQEVAAGEVIGLGGNTGRSYGAHLHFEIRFYDAPMNPEEIIDFAKKEVKDENLMVHSAIFRPGAKPSDYQAAGENIASVQSTPAVTTARRYYKVRSGDTLGEIASRNNTTVSKLCSLNGIKPTTILQVGRQLRVK